MNLLLQLATAMAMSVSLQSSVVTTAIDSQSKTQAKVDLVELNHFLDDHGREVFRQVVFYDWSGKNRQFEVRAWRLVKHSSQLPRQQHRGEGYIVRWQDKHLTREVIARTMRETFSQDDPERINRHILPENERRPLWPSGESR
ncbi:hypothetical protein [Roseiconus lacunae]|uniref:Uncharacterized protein n=1 Tax=Roseiconus lacunae TaxID=2605694 RepID=A0ABT7PL65_9BACT|nr:hypothetical protein [Roseiconus lacunae]MCD0461475.1 hypothetical protein [Roseiconus lacunae]MDM4017242.1 hypothetical protein [Roseiconus lacunae]WRQ51181.1 hypothetical protein U8335_01285 [Stieleria sp. HD01]